MGGQSMEMIGCVGIGGIGRKPIPGSSLRRRWMELMLALAYACGAGPPAPDGLRSPPMENEFREVKPRKPDLFIPC